MRMSTSPDSGLPRYWRKFSSVRLSTPLFCTHFLIPSIIYTAYNTSSIFHERAFGVYQSISSIESWKDNQASEKGGDKAIESWIIHLRYIPNSFGERIIFNLNSWKVFKENPIFGVGTGDFPNEYMRINEQYTPNLKTAVNPHNMYMLISVQLGLLGLISMILIFYFQIKASFHEKNKLYRDLGLALPLSFLVIMLSDSYILGHFTTLLFVFFSSFLYQKFE